MQWSIAFVGCFVINMIPVFAASCAFHPIPLPPVGPGPLAEWAPGPRGQGALQVFTETEGLLTDRGLYLPHSD
jgi:hypothetical protein